MKKMGIQSLGPGFMDHNGERHHSDTFITTSFRLHAWWLKTFGGYTMESMHRVPKQNFFGEIYYKNHWVLSKKPEGE